MMLEIVEFIKLGKKKLKEKSLFKVLFNTFNITTVSVFYFFGCLLGSYILQSLLPVFFPLVLIPNLLLRKYHCPRCLTKSIIEYMNTFDCPYCFLEFDKKDFELIEDESNILSIQEKFNIIKILKDEV